MSHFCGGEETKVWPALENCHWSSKLCMQSHRWTKTWLKTRAIETIQSCTPTAAEYFSSLLHRNSTEHLIFTCSKVIHHTFLHSLIWLCQQYDLSTFKEHLVKRNSTDTLSNYTTSHCSQISCFPLSPAHSVSETWLYLFQLLFLSYYVVFFILTKDPWVYCSVFVLSTFYVCLSVLSSYILSTLVITISNPGLPEEDTAVLELEGVKQLICCRFQSFPAHSVALTLYELL